MAVPEPSGIELAWRAGHLEFLLEPQQVAIYRDMRAQLWGQGGYRAPDGPERRYILKCHRRFGKSFLSGVLAVELCLAVPHARVYWAAETGKQVRQIILPNLRILLATCPEDLRPTWKMAEGVWAFPNGAKIHIAGCEDEEKADRLRGDGAELFILDEAGSIKPLRYVYRSIALWMVSRSGGRIIMPSSPAKTPAHDFTAYCHLAEAGEGGYACRTVYDSGWNQELLEELARECGGETTTEWRREALAEDVVDESRAIIPEFIYQVNNIVRESEPPPYLVAYTTMDCGFERDLTAVLLSYWDLRRAKLVVWDELELAHARTDQLADALKRLEAQSWGEVKGRMAREMHSPDFELYRWVDCEPRLRADLDVLHGLSFVQTRKDNREAAINECRLWVQQGKVEINPRCRRLIAHLKAGIWNERRTDWERIEGFGHFDFIAALVYQVRNTDCELNPYPPLPPDAREDTHWIRTEKLEPAAGEEWAEIFTPKLT